MISKGIWRNLKSLSTLAGPGRKIFAKLSKNIDLAKLNSKDRDQLKGHLIKMADQMGSLKGSFMKVGQMFSVYGEYLLDEELNKYLVELQSNAKPIEWSVMEPVIQSTYKDHYSQLVINPIPIASASIGQVYKAEKSSIKLAVKVQYPNVDLAIDSDLKLIETLLSLTGLAPGMPSMSEIKNELRDMMEQELNYEIESKWYHFFKSQLTSDQRFIVPEVIAEFSSKNVLTMSYEPSQPLSKALVDSLSEYEKNHLADSFLELYLRELFLWGAIQTDPHHGNFGVRLNENSDPQWVLYDFGAVRKLSPIFLDPYKKMIHNSLLKDWDNVEANAIELGFLKPKDPPELKELFRHFCYLMTEPFDLPREEIRDLYTKEGHYRWHKSDLPLRLSAQVRLIKDGFPLRAPPQEVVFIDRKLVGVFITLSKLKCQVDARAELLKYMPGETISTSNE